MLSQRMLIALLLVALIPLSLIASPAKDLEKAAEKGKVAFVLVTDKETGDMEKVKDIIKDAIKQVKRSVMVELDRSKNDNADIISKYRLSSVPVPLIIAIYPNNTISGGIPAEKATAEILVNMVPSPKKAELMKALSDGNAVLLTVSSKDMKSVRSVSDSCAIACQKASGKTICINVDLNDKDEKSFLTELKVDPNSSEPVTIVANPQGQVAAKYTGAVKVDDLIQATTKKIGGCCPSKVTGGSSTCEPAKK